MALAWLQHLLSHRHLSAYADGELASGLRRRVEGHLARCARCRAEVEELQATARTLSLLPQEAPPRSFALGPDQVAAPARRPPPALALRGLQAATVAFSVLLVALVAWDVAGPATSEQAAAPAGSQSAPAAAPREAPEGAGAALAATPTPAPTRPDMGLAGPQATPTPADRRRQTEEAPAAEAGEETGRSLLRVAQVAAGVAAGLAAGAWAVLAIRSRRAS